MSRRKRVLLPLLALAFVFAGARAAHACSCGRVSTVLDSYDWADVVVVARAFSLERAAKRDEPQEVRGGYRDVVSTKMAVEQVFKGELKPGDEMVFAQGGGADCIYTFDEEDIGRKYLFYLKRLKGAAVWIAGTCGRSRRVEYAHDDLLYLNRLAKTRGRTRVSGTVYFGGAREQPSVAGLKIRISGAGKTHEARTDEKGVYEIYDLPAGKYTLEPEAPRGWKVSDYHLRYSSSFAGDKEAQVPKAIPFTLEEKRHAGFDLHFRVDNAVSGKIYDTTGKPLNRVCLELVPAAGETAERLYKGDCTENGGEFRIEEIPPGAYVLVVNKEGKVTSSEPFGTFYHPNASRREDATVFQIGPGDFVENVQVYVPKMEETVTVEGLLLYSDGRPVADELVNFRTENSDEDDYPEAQAKTDAKGRFSMRVLKGMAGRLYSEFHTYAGEYENCPALEALIGKIGDNVAEVRTPAVELRAERDVHGVELRYPFPFCKKAK